MTRDVAPEAWRSLADALKVEEAALRAVAQVESSGSGFLPPPSDLPKVLFEGHAFHRLTQGRFAASHPTLSFPKWTREHYAGTATGEWARLTRACELDRMAALQSASWGAFQVMGFNHALCGFSDVEPFVAAQRSGAEGQLESFARFIARDLFLVALRAHDWAAFARAYNGPAFAKNKYDTKLAAAYAAFAASRAPAGRAGLTPPRRRRVPAAASRPPLGRPLFASTPTVRRQPFRRSVKPDPVDLRDWLYRPDVAVAPLPVVLPHDARPVTHQGDTNACTGFALATVIEYLLDRGRRPVEPISGFMLYDMARRYDEWQDDEADEGSSLRGALKGWSRHGASAARLWKALKMPKAASRPDDDWWHDAVKRPLGTYYRIKPDAIGDMHIALSEAGVVYASAMTHGGWDALHGEAASTPPVSPDDLPLIDCRQGLEDGGHAFAIVGYTEKGFIVQNSWGTSWGRGGFAILSYADWRQNAMDCWVVQLGVVTTEHQHVARAATLRLETLPSGRSSDRVVVSSSATLAAHEIAPFVVDLQDGGRLSDRGQFRTNEDDLRLLLDEHLRTACERWSIRKRDTLDVAIYAHGGLVGEADAAETARAWIPLLYSNRIFPVFLMWETAPLTSVFNLVEGALRDEEGRLGTDWWDRFTQSLADWRNERIEGLTRRPGHALWRAMTGNASDISSTSASGVIKLFRLFKERGRRARLPAIRLHLIGHSAGAIVHTWLAPRARRAGFAVASLSLLGPAVRVNLFDVQLAPMLRRDQVRVLVAHLTDAAERGDPSCPPYGHSLLYLVSRAFEAEADAAILGMEKHLVPAVVGHEWGASIRRLASPGAAFRPGDRLTVATTHGGLDRDRAIQDAVVRHIKGPRFAGSVIRAVGPY